MNSGHQRHGGAEQPDSAAVFAAALQKYRAGNAGAAARRCRDLLARNPDDAAALGLLGLICLDRSRFAEAAVHLRRAAEARPDNARLHFLLGTVFIAQRSHAEAENALRRALELAPRDEAAWNHLGTALIGLGRNEEAIACHQQALAMRPGYAPALYNLGRAYLRESRPEAAVDLFRAAAQNAAGAETSRLIEIYDYLFGTLLTLGRDDEARAVCDTLRALGTPPDIVTWNEGLLLLKQGRFAEGWPKYECRYVAGRSPPHPRVRPLDLADVEGKRVLLCGEQGHGDVIQFVRYAPLVAERGAEVCLLVYRELQPLLRGMDCVTTVVGPDDPELPADLVAALPSLPLVFGTELGSIPSAVPYLRAPADRRASWAERLGPRDRPRIGLAWRGSERSAQHAAMPVMSLAPLLRRRDLAFEVVQKEVSDRDRRWLQAQGAVRLHADALADYADTAAVIENLDLVVTIDTSVAHLAGALGRPVWIMLPFSAEWRWLVGRSDSPWYPTARLFRQPAPGDWDAVVCQVVRELDAFLTNWGRIGCVTTADV